MAEYRASARGVRKPWRVRTLRADLTDAERALWQRLRSRVVAGHKFRRQHEFGPFVLDFYCPAAKLVVEVDGGQHFTDEAQAHDANRTAFLNSHGIQVLRFTNTEVLTQMDAVLEAILRVLPPSPRGRG